MEFISQSGVNHKVQRLYIHWDITTVCEYKCSYCYAIKEYDNNWMRPGNWKNQQKVIEELSKATLPIFLGLLGGEPTSHYKFKEMIDQIDDKVLHHDDSRLYITTNGYKDISFFKNMKTYEDNKHYILWSWHPEYNDIKTNKQYIDKLKLMIRKGYQSKINIMLHPAKKYWKITQDFIHECIKIHSLDIHPHFIYTSPHETVKYSNEFYKEFDFSLKILRNKEFIFKTKDKELFLDDINIFKNKYNKFKGWNCWNNNYEINLYCQVNQFCFEEKHNIKKDYFKDIKKVYPKICPHNYCSCDGLLKIKKEKI